MYYVVIQDGIIMIYNNWCVFDVDLRIKTKTKFCGVQILGWGENQTRKRLSKIRGPGQPKGVWRRSPHICGRVPSVSPSFLKDIVDGRSTLDCLLAGLNSP